MQKKGKIGFRLGGFLMFTFRLWEFIIFRRDYVTRNFAQLMPVWIAAIFVTILF